MEERQLMCMLLSKCVSFCIVAYIYALNGPIRDNDDDK